MQSFVHLDRLLRQVPGSLVTELGRVDIGRGRQELFRHQLPTLLDEVTVIPGLRH